MSGIVWLASYPRSGNTWLRILLDRLLHPETELNINALNSHSPWDIGHRWYQPALATPLKTTSRNTVAQVRPFVQASIARRAKNLVFCKTHAALLKHRGTPTINGKVTAGAIHIIRHPGDVAVSLARHLGLSLDRSIEIMGTAGFETNNHENAAYEPWGSWSEHSESWLRASHRSILHLRYEDVLSQTEHSVDRICQHLQFKISAANIRRAIEQASLGRLQKQEKAYGFKERPQSSTAFFRNGTTGQWQSMLTEQQQLQIHRDHGAMMMHWNYDFQTQPRTECHEQ